MVSNNNANILTNPSRRVCCVPGCGTSKQKNANLMFHTFPSSDGTVTIVNHFGVTESVNRRTLWLKKLRMPAKFNPVGKVVCSEHFTDSDYYIPCVPGLPEFPGSRKQLLKTAIPSRNIRCQSSLIRLSSQPAIVLRNRNSRVMGKKRIQQNESITPMKIEVKDEIGDNDVVVARDRLKGALREILHHSETESSESSGDDSQDYRPSYRRMETSMRQKVNYQNRKVKRRRQLPIDPAFHHTYVMKLFDRSVDLAQFKEDTPLYPICRAWMANQPRNPNLIPKVRSPSPEIVEEPNIEEPIFDANGELREIVTLPPPLPSEEAFPRNRIPSPIPREKEELNLNYGEQTLKSKEALIKEHKEHWTALRKKWHQQAHKNEKRFAKSAHILGTIFKKAQSEYE